MKTEKIIQKMAKNEKNGIQTDVMKKKIGKKFEESIK